MRNKLSLTLLVLAALLLVANVVVMVAPEPAVLSLDASKVERIARQKLQKDGSMKNRSDITEPEEIALVCDVFSTAFWVELPPDALAYEELDPQSLIHFVFHMSDGTTVTVSGPSENRVYFNDRWYHGSCGEAYGYKSFFRVLNDIICRK